MHTRAQEHVQNCRTSAAHAVASILDPATGDYDYLPYFYSRIFNLSWQVLSFRPFLTAPSNLAGKTSVELLPCNKKGLHSRAQCVCQCG